MKRYQIAAARAQVAAAQALKQSIDPRIIKIAQMPLSEGTRPVSQVVEDASTGIKRYQIAAARAQVAAAEALKQVVDPRLARIAAMSLSEGTRPLPVSKVVEAVQNTAKNKRAEDRQHNDDGTNDY